MIWESKNYHPEQGEKRIRYVFAWKPTEVGKWMVWLDSYMIHETFFVPAGGEPGWWYETKREPAGDD